MVRGVIGSIAALLVAVVPAAAQVPAAIEELELVEPDVAEVRAAAVRRAGLDPERAAGWARRARWAGAVPELTVRVTRALARDENLAIETEAVGRLRIATGHDLVVEARASWDLGRLVFDPAELRAAREGARLAAERLDLESEVTRLYYQRRRLQMDWILDPPDDPAESARRRLELDELTAALDALTGGWFSREIARRPRE